MRATMEVTRRLKRSLLNYKMELKVRRLTEDSELSQLRGRGGYVLNISPSVARIHRAECFTVGWMNLDKRGGVYHAATLKVALGWLEAEGIKGVPCKLCLPALTYSPRPQSLIEHI